MQPAWRRFSLSQRNDRRVTSSSPADRLERTKLTRGARLSEPEHPGIQNHDHIQVSIL